MGTGTAASSSRPEDTRRSDSEGVLRRRGPSARSTGTRPYASQVVRSSRSPWCAAPRPGGAVPQAIGRPGCTLDTVRGFRDLRTARTPLGSGHPPDRGVVRHPPRCNEALPSGRASAFAGLRRRASSTCASPAGCRRERVRAASSTATCCISIASYRSPAPRTLGPPSTSCSVEAACEPLPHGTCRPACGHILPRGPVLAGAASGPSYRVRTARNAGSFRCAPAHRPVFHRTVRSTGDIGWTVRCLQDGRQMCRG